MSEMKKEKMKYSDRYTSLCIRFKPDEWKSLIEAYEGAVIETGIKFSKHKFVKALIRAALDK